LRITFSASDSGGRLVGTPPSSARHTRPAPGGSPFGARRGAGPSRPRRRGRSSSMNRGASKADRIVPRCRCAPRGAAPTGDLPTHHVALRPDALGVHETVAGLWATVSTPTSICTKVGPRAQLEGSAVPRPWRREVTTTSTTFVVDENGGSTSPGPLPLPWARSNRRSSIRTSPLNGAHARCLDLPRQGSEPGQGGRWRSGAGVGARRGWR